ncbi:MAG: trehalose-phosphatase [Actinomycetales bacterium]|nr:trehalose-phosphatase [Actinomycetales bacterium]
MADPTQALAALAADPSRVLLALDFDGTLAPLVDHPLDARPLPASMAAVERIAAAGVHVALVSGRGLEELSTVTGPVPEGTWLVGSHGAEFGRIRDGVYVLEPFELSPEALSKQDELMTVAEDIAARHEGVLAQRKPTTVLVHTKMAHPDVEALATAEAVALGNAHSLKTVVGKHIVEIAVHTAHKGEGVDALRRALGTTVVVYVGDDTTDEDALEALREGDVGVKVGPGPTAGRFRVDSPEAVAGLLEGFAGRLEAAATGV